MICAECIWLSTGISDPNGYGYCYSEGDYVEAEGTCAHWQASMRDEPLAPPPEAQLAANVAVMDIEVDD